MVSLFFTIMKKTLQWKKGIVFLTNGARVIGHLYAKGKKITSIYILNHVQKIMNHILKCKISNYKTLRIKRK